MYFFIKCLIIFVSLKDVVESCMRTGAGNGGGVPVDPCAACPPVALEPGNPDNRVDPQAVGPAANNGVCEETVTCTPRNAGGDVFMEFNVNEGGPANNIAPL
ncbi:hypothetical protein FO519_010104, partial [Halicephalobus sp. NKZ332]